MPSETEMPVFRTLRRPHACADRPFVANATVLWSSCLALVAVDLLGLPSAGFGLDIGAVLNQNVMVAAILFPLALFYTYYRFDKGMASILGAVCLLAILIPILCVMSYIACADGARFPLRDDALAAFDESLGFHWPSLLRWADAHPFWSNLGGMAYRSFIAQASVMAVLLSLRGQADRLQAAVYAFAIGAVACSVVSCFLPALGAYAHYGIDPALHSHIDLLVKDLTVPTVSDLRSGRFSSLSAGRSQGIISFPSFHTHLGILFCWAFWRIKGLRWFVVVLNIALIAGTPLQGSHYLADVVAGLAVAVVSITAASRLHTLVAASTGRTRRESGFDREAGIASGGSVA